MMRRARPMILIAALAAGQVAAQSLSPGNVANCASAEGNASPESLLRLVRAASFPELSRVDLRVRSFRSQSDFLRTRFAIARFFLPVHMRYFVDINPVLSSDSPRVEGICAILAHELSHVAALSHGNRIRRLGLVSLLSKSHAARFERRTDLEAIHRGYAEGLKSYRVWVYAHIPPEALAAKKRNYFSPQEITAIEGGLRRTPELYDYWREHVPLNLPEIQARLK